MQRAVGIAILGPTSNITHYQQALGRIDRIDTPYPAIRYLTFALPPNLLVFASDRRFRERLRHNYPLPGTRRRATSIGRTERSRRAR